MSDHYTLCYFVLDSLQVSSLDNILYGCPKGEVSQGRVGHSGNKMLARRVCNLDGM